MPKPKTLPAAPPAKTQTNKLNAKKPKKAVEGRMAECTICGNRRKAKCTSPTGVHSEYILEMPVGPPPVTDPEVLALQTPVPAFDAKGIDYGVEGDPCDYDLALGWLAMGMTREAVRAEYAKAAARRKEKAIAEERTEKELAEAEKYAKEHVITPTGKRSTAAPKEEKTPADKAPRAGVLGTQFSATQVMRWMGANGWKAEEAEAAFKASGLTPSMATIRIQVRAGTKGGDCDGRGPIPELTPAQVAELNKARPGTVGK